MKIKMQFIISIALFSVVFLIIAASVANTEQQVDHLGAQEVISSSIERGASNLNSISIDYFLYEEDLQFSRWQSALSSLSNDLSNLKPNNQQQQTLVNNVAKDLQDLNESFAQVVSYLESAPRNVSVRIDPAFQIRWSGMAVQSQALAFDASQLSHSLNDQAHQLNDTNTLLIVSLVAAFGAFLLTIYFMVFRRTLKSVTDLQNGINTIGSGNLDYTIKFEGQNEITELSRSFNQMTTNLKNVTASKTELEKAQASLRESEQRWATTLASIGDAVIATDLSGNVTFMNGIAEELTGWTLNEASQKPVKTVFNIINEQTRLGVENPIVRVLKEGMIVGLANHTVLIRKDGAEIPVDDSAAPIKDRDGETSGVVLIFRDITERKKAEEALKASEEEYRSLFENIADGFAYCKNLYDENGKPVDFVYLQVNDAFEKITGLKKEDIIGKKVTEAIPGIEKENPELFEIYGRVALMGQNERFEIFFKPLSLWLHVSVYSPKKGYFAAVFEDITLRKEMQAKLQDYSKNLEDLVEERTKQLKDAERLAAIGQTAGMVGHDIRNPLQAIVSDVYLAKTELDSLPESNEKNNTLESLGEIEKNIDYINKIVADLQDFARPLNPRDEETDLKLTIENLLAKNGIPDNIKVNVKVESDVRKITADCTFINRIMSNLVNNGVQAMPNGGKLTINANRDKKTNDVVITVKDTGVGIPEDIKSKMFTPMFTTKSKGQGLGLAVVKRMTETFGGTVTFESEVGKGTKFIVRIPLKK